MIQGERGLRETRRARTRQTIQHHAMRLFSERGYDATTVAEIAAAAEVSSMTVFRYFPTKEDLLLADDYDPALVDHIRAQPDDRPWVARISAALVESTAAHHPAERAALLARLRIGMGVPALRARMWDGQYQTQRHLVEALGDGDPDRDFALWVAAAACIAAATVAIVRWAESDGTADLDALMAQGQHAITTTHRSHP